jgi:hypothetical protein
MARSTGHLTWTGFLLRFLFAILLVFATYNPTGYSWFRWVLSSGFEDAANWTTMLPVKAFATLVLVIGWIIYLRASLRSLGPIGLVIAGLFFITIVWLLVHFGLLELGSATVVSYVVLLVLSGVLTVGMSWSHIRRRLTGQMDVDEIEEG